MKYISLKVFLISFSVGILFMYILGPTKKTVYIYPTPDNIDTYAMKDVADNFFQYIPSKTACPANPDDIKTQPIQTGEDSLV